MSDDPASEPVGHADDDVRGRLAVIDHHLHQISTHLATISTLLRQLDEIQTNLDTLIESLKLTGLSGGEGREREAPGCAKRAP
ncbi:MAG: hypothetical protein ACRDRU_19685 [Pseudonocardiaceae bacterium]